MAGVAEVLHARLDGFAYPPHCHETWTVLLVDDGAVRYDLDGRTLDAGRGTVNVLPPHVVHDGRPGPSGMRKRVLYLDERWLDHRLAGRAVDGGPLAGAELAGVVASVHERLVAHDDLAAESALAFAVERIVARLDLRRAAPAVLEPGAARGLRRLLDAAPVHDVSLAGAAAQLDRSITHLVRSFRAAYGIAPHAYVTARRVEHARRRLLDGEAPAAVAAAVGFYDQAHLTRHFRRHTSTTPAAFARSAR